MIVFSFGLFTPPIKLSKASVNQSLIFQQGFFIENKGQWDPNILFVRETKSSYMMITKDFLQGNEADGIEELPFFHNYFIGNDPSRWASHCYIYAKVVIKDSRGKTLQTLSPANDIMQLHQSMRNAGPLLYSTYLGGSKNDFATDVSIDDNDCAYVLGYTESLNFPSKNPTQSKNNGGNDVFITKLSPTGQPVFSTYLGGSKDDFGAKITFDNSGNIYFTGKTYSSNFPIKNAYQTKNKGGLDAFVTKLNPSGTAIVFSTYFGGSGADWAKDLDVDKEGKTCITGGTDSTNFPIRNAFQVKNKGGVDAFVVKLCEHGQHLYTSSYLGGSMEDCANSISTYNGISYISGYTKSTNFSTILPYQIKNNGGTDAFLAKVDINKSALLYSSYLGGSENDEARDCTLDSNLNILMTGYSYSKNFPIKNAYQNKMNGVDDAFVTKLNPSGSSILFSTYLGGSGGDWCNDIDTDENGNCYLTGGTISENFPTKNAFQLNNMGKTDVFFSKLSSNGTTLLYSSYFGGNEDEWSNNIDLGYQDRVIYVAGGTKSNNFPLQNEAQQQFKGSEDAFVFKFNLNAIPSNPIETIIIELWIGNKSARVNEKVVLLDSPPLIIKGRTMVPLRFISEAFNAKVSYDAKYQKIQIEFETTSITLMINSPMASVQTWSNGQINTRVITLDVPPLIRNGRTLVPVRFIADAFEAKTDWNSLEQKITITLERLKLLPN